MRFIPPAMLLFRASQNFKDRNEYTNGKRSRLLAVAIAVEGLSGFLQSRYR
jgi:hypothetical protein